MPQAKPQMFHGRFNRGNRYYFITLNDRGKGAYLQVAQSTLREGAWVRQNIYLHPDDLPGFVRLVTLAMERLPDMPAVGQERPWTKVEDDLLRAGVRAGRTLAAIARVHERQEADVADRIRRLKLEAPKKEESMA